MTPDALYGHVCYASQLLQYVKMDAALGSENATYTLHNHTIGNDCPN